MTIGDKIMDEPKFIKILDSCKKDLRNYCQRIARQCLDRTYTWEDFFQEAVCDMWKEYLKGYQLPVKTYLCCGKQAVIDATRKISAAKRTMNLRVRERDERLDKVMVDYDGIKRIGRLEE